MAAESEGEAFQVNEMGVPGTNHSEEGSEAKEPPNATEKCKESLLGGMEA